jgi:hypothetical protein
MTAHYELWQTDDGHCMFGVPCADRGQFIHEPGAHLLLRFDAASPDDAKAIRDRFLYEGNPEGLVPLAIPASEFFFSQYRCGVSAGEIVRLMMDYHSAADGYYFGHFELGTSFTILPGDIEAPQRVWMRVQHSPSGSAPVGQFHFVVGDEHFFTYFQRVHESAA